MPRAAAMVSQNEPTAWKGRDASNKAQAAPCVERWRDEPRVASPSLAVPVSLGYAYVSPLRASKHLLPYQTQDRFWGSEDNCSKGRTETTPLSCFPASQSDCGDRRLPQYHYRYYTFPDPASAADNSKNNGTGDATPDLEPCYVETLDLSDYLDSDSHPEPTKHERELENLAAESDLAGRKRRRGCWWRVHQVAVMFCWVLLVVVWISVATAVTWRVKGSSEFVTRRWDGNRIEAGDWAPCTASRPRFCRLVVGAEM